MKKEKKSLTLLSLVMITIAGIVNLRNLPIMSKEGFSSLFFYLMAALLFLIPSAFVCSELASAFPEAGGVYLWVEMAFGKRIGFFAIWSEWFNNLIGVPATLSFITATLSYMFIPHISQHKLLLVSVMLVILWSATLFNFFGIRYSSRLNIIGAIFGSIIPALVITVLGVMWFSVGNKLQINFSLHSFIPKMHFENLSLFIGVLSGYAGMQITAFHAQDVKNPKRDFPLSVLISTIIILAITMFGSLAIAMVVPAKNLSLVSGVMSGFYDFFHRFHLDCLVYIVSFLIFISGISTLSAWLLAPARGLVVAAKDGLFPKLFAYENRNNIPTNILLLQAVVATLLSFLFVFINSLSEAFWILIVLTSQFTLVMYVLIYISAMKLSVTRGFLSIVSVVSIIVCFIGILLGFFPPASIVIKNKLLYETIIISGDIIYLVLPMLFLKS